MKHGLPNGTRVGGGLKGFFRAREAERRAKEEAAEDEAQETLQPEVVIVDEIDGPVVEHGFSQVEGEQQEPEAGCRVTDTGEKEWYVAVPDELTEELNKAIQEDPDPAGPEDVISEEEVAAEIVTAKPKRKKRTYKRKKRGKKSTATS